MKISTHRIRTPIGHLVGFAEKEGICGLFFFDEDQILSNDLHEKFDGEVEIIKGEDKNLQNLEIQLDEYFQHKRKHFDLPLALKGTLFQQEIWSLLLQIPYGTVISYKKLSDLWGDPKAIRAVAAANGANPVSILVPCHRVIGADGSMTGYAGGIWRKQWLLDHEKDQLRLNL
ncbi:MAG: methylated-DNA--[protein]-cysteine S-methyltransferase [bacterium]